MRFGKLFLVFLAITGALAQSVRPTAVNQAEPMPFIPNGVTNFGTIVLDPNDLDADGLPNGYEAANGLNPADPSDALADSDDDGLLNLEEFQIGTDPQNPDSDGDGFTDLEETIAGTDPRNNQSFPNAPVVIPTLTSLTATPSFGVITVNSVLGTVPLQLRVTAHFSDGATRDVTDDFRTHYRSSDPGVANATDAGALIGFSAGSATITVTRHPISIELPFDVELFTPQIIGKTDVSGVNAVAIQGQTLLVGRDAGLDVYDVSAPDTPALVASVDPGGQVDDVKALGELVFAALSGSGVKTFDLSTLPAAPVEIGSLALAGAESLAVAGDRLAVAAGDRVALVDVADPSAPVLLQTAPDPADRVAYEDGVIYALANGTLSIYRPGAEDTLTRLSQTAVNGARDLAVRDSYVFAGTTSGLTTVDAFDAVAPAVAARLPNRFNVFGVAYLNNHVFMAENRFINLVPIVNVADPANPILAANPQINDDADGRDVAVDGSLAAVATDEGFQLVRWFVDNLGAAPTILEFTATPTALTGGQDIAVTVTAVDDVFVAATELLVNGATTQRKTGDTVSFTVATPISPTGGTLELQARVSDGSGAAALSPVETITLLPDSEAPTVTFLEPLDGDIVPPGNLRVSVAAEDNLAVERVELFLDGALAATRTAPPYDFFPFIPVPIGESPLQIRAVAHDAAGNAGQGEITVTVPSVSELTVIPERGVLVGMNSMLGLRVIGLLTDGVTQVDLTADPGTAYVSSDPGVATVSAGGVVAALANGAVTITAASGGMTAEAALQVYATPPDPGDVTPPHTAINGLAPNQTSARFEIAYNLLSGFHDFAGARLFYRRNASGAMMQYRPAENPSGIYYGPVIPFDANQTGGDGLYELYTSARDINGNLEPAPAVFAETLVDTGQPTLDIPDGTLIDTGDLTYDFRRVRIDGGTVTINGEHRFISVEVINGGVMTTQASSASETRRLHIRAGPLEIDATSRIDVSGKGFLGANQGDNAGSFGRTAGNRPTAIANAGGSYGGLGGVGNGNLRVPSYGEFRMPRLPGTGGSENAFGGNGGGALRIEATVVTLDGRLEADGDAGSSRAGSGGSILIQTGVLTGDGAITANGGNNFIDGGGGRIAIHYDNMDGFDRANIQAYGAPDSSGDDAGGAGTIFLKAATQTDGELIIDNDDHQTNGITTLLPNLGRGTSDALTANDTMTATTLVDAGADFPLPDPANGIPGLIGLRLNPNTAQDESFAIIGNTATSVTVAGDMTAVAAAGDRYSGVLLLDTLEIAGRANASFGSDRAVISDRLDLLERGVLTIPFATISRAHQLEVAAGAIHIDADSAIDVTEKGFLGANRGDNTGSFARTLGNAPVAIANAGGSYGGLGGVGNGNVRVPSYGGFRRPTLPGTGGSENAPAGNGGGVVRLTADSLVVEGAIRADGGGGSSRAGSGGSILIEVGALSGAGLITAVGGNNFLDGGGGRIAIYYDDLSGFDAARIQAHGESDSSSADAGGAGTVFLRSSAQANGELILDNDGHQTSGITTLLRNLGRGTSDALTADTLTDANASFPLPDPATGAPGLIGLRLNPNTAQDESFEIIDNTADTITVAGDMTAVASAGDRYSGAILLDRLTIANLANASFGSDRVTATERIDLRNEAALTIPFATTSLTHQLDVVAGAIHIDAASAIDVAEKGFLGANRGDNAGGFARTLGNVPVAIANAGGSYGGLGGVGNGNVRVPSYGGFRRPTLPGTGGSENAVAGNGGGVVRLRTDLLEVDGAIRADGGGGSSRAGSGGSILIEVGALTGAGLISAVGGNNFVDGGGGRIAVHYDDISGFDLSRIQAHGSADSSSLDAGGAGTIFLQSAVQTDGELIIDNDDHQTSGITTLLRNLGRGTSDALTADTLTDDNANFPLPDPTTGAPGLIGLRLNPNTAQDESFEIIDNTADTITVAGDMTAVASAGDRYSGAILLDRLTIANLANASFGSDRVTATERIDLRNEATLTIPFATTNLTHQLDVKTGTLRIDLDSAIDVAGKGFLGANRGDNASGFARTIGNTPVAIANAGGSYGGLGGVGNGNVRVPSYGGFRRPTLPGTGGSENAAAGNGGGVARLDADILELDGAIRADGGAGASRAGSGGSILIEVGTLTGAGLISAVGGANSIDGGGGRIAVYYDDLSGFDLSRIQAHGSADSSSLDAGGAGTIFLQSAVQADGELIIDNDDHQTSGVTTVLRSVGRGTSTALTADTLTDAAASFPLPNPATGAAGLTGLRLNPNTAQDETFMIIANTATTITVAGDMTAVAAPGHEYSGVTRLDRLVLVNRANATFGSDRAEVVDRFDILNHGLLTIPFATTNLTHQLDVKAGILRIDPDSAIDVADKGFLGANRGDNASGFARTIGNTPVAIANAGGSYGGLGGVGNGNVRVPSYGDFRLPTLPGTGGSENAAAGNGGGVARLDADTLELDGAIRADGGPGSSRAGSGGSILIHVGTLTGAGEITAVGGNNFVDGGGGRIAVYYDNLNGFNRDNFKAHGAADSSTADAGGAGTIFLKSPAQTHGELIIDNNGHNTSGFTTILRSVGPGNSTALTAATLTDAGAAFPAPDPATGALGLIGLQLNPNRNQDQTFAINGNTATEIAVDGDMSAVASPGDPYVGVYFFDALTVVGRARVFTGDMIRVVGSGLVIDDATLVSDELKTDGAGGNIDLTNANLTLSTENMGVFDQFNLTDSTVTLDGDGVLQGADMTLVNSALTVSEPTLGLVSAVKLDLSGALAVDADSVITVVDKGFPGGLRGDNPDAHGLTLGFAPGSQLADGGSHGGLGGVNNAGGDPTQNFVNPTYGDMTAPTDPGSGGGGTTNGRGEGGNGGGVIDIQAADLALDGQILADGGAGQGSQGAPGSGGSVLISLTNTLSGAGTISARGGARTGSGAGGGGGGRVALSFQDDSGFSGAVQADGGIGNPAGGAGTIFTQSNRGSVLRVANAAPSVIDEGQLDGAGAAHVIAKHGGFEPDMLAGLVLAPQAEPTLGYRILGNDERRIDLDVPKDESLPDTLVAGETYLILDPKPAEPPWTPLPLVGTGALTEVGEQILFDDSAAWPPGALAGQWLKVGADERRLFRISANDRHSLTLETAGQDLRELLRPGDGYHGVLALNALETLGSARMSFEGELQLLGLDDRSPLYVTGEVEGDALTIESQAPVSLQGLLRLNRLRLDDAPALRIDGGGLTLKDDRRALRAPALSLENGAWIAVEHGVGGRPATLTIETEDLWVDADSRIDLTGKDRLAGGPIYADPSNPRDLGAGGGRDPNQPGGSGGGRLILRADAIRLDGLLAADGEDAWGAAGAGPGGLIAIRAGTLQGEGWIRANGGSARDAEGRAGDGGRIRLDIDALTFDMARISAAAGRQAKAPPDQTPREHAPQDGTVTVGGRQ